MSCSQTVMSPPTVRVKISDSPILPLLVTVFTSILEVFLLCLAGYILAGRGILDKKTQKQLNRLNVSLFTPSLLFSKVAFFLSPEKLRELWIIPIFFVLVTAVSMSVSFLLGWVFRVKRSQRNFAMAAAMFMNSNSLPIALMQSLVVTVPGLKWGPDDNKNAMVGRALTYLVLYSTLGMVLRWSYGRRPVLFTMGTMGTMGHVGFHSQEATLGPSDALPEIQRRRSRFYNSFPNSPNQSRVKLPTIDSPPETAVSTAVVNSPDASDSESDTETRPFLPGDAEAQAPASAPAPPLRPRRHTRGLSTLSSGPPTTPFRMTLRRTRRRAYRAWVALNEFMTVPLWAALASIIVACVYPLQHALEEHMQPSPERTLRPMASTAVAGAECAGDKPSRPGETKTVVIAVASRMIITPLLLLPLFALGTKFDLHQIFDDPVFVVANVLLVVLSPGTDARAGTPCLGDAFERLISRTIFWAYCVVTPPATIAYVVIGLVLAKL
ncbi:membrane transport protein-domain-containing protein [Mycena rebaudengoi]|nr:membrane transport protein-domain-containing protein [Mycena rebaudengoi]